MDSAFERSKNSEVVADDQGEDAGLGIETQRERFQRCDSQVVIPGLEISQALTSLSEREINYLVWAILLGVFPLLMAGANFNENNFEMEMPNGQI